MAKLSAFGQAFKDARARGDATFEFNGKKYTTEMAGEKKAAAPKTTAKPMPSVDEDFPPAPPQRTPTRTTSMPSGSAMGAIARSQGAESTFPEPTESRSFNAERAARQRAETEQGFSNVLRKLKRTFGTQAMRDEEASEGMRKGGKVSSASKRADGIAQRGKTRGKYL